MCQRGVLARRRVVGQDSVTRVLPHGVAGSRARLWAAKALRAGMGGNGSGTGMTTPLRRGIETSTAHAEAPAGTVGVRRMRGPTHPSGHSVLSFTNEKRDASIA